jgi:RNA polymerase sigma factor (sigma-70 family)
MRKSHQSPILREIRALFGEGTHAGLTDGELLERFVDRDGETAQFAFATLMERHGPMVFRVCRRLLADADETQDAFQATFLILVRKAGSLRDRGSVSPWLFGVACRVAAKSRTAAARRAHHERQYGERLEARGSTEDHERTDLEGLLHEEVRRLPDRYRIPIVLCYLEGVTQEDAAASLGWPLGTVRSRLARARERLRGRLTRRGVVLSAGALTQALAGDASAAPRVLVDSTLRAAMSFAGGRAAAGLVSASVDALTQGVLRSLFMTKLTTTVTLLTTLAAGATGAGVFAYQPDAPVASEAHSRQEMAPKNQRLIAFADEREAKEREAKEMALKERLHKALDRASKEQVVKALLDIGSVDQVRTALFNEAEAREREAKEMAAKERVQKAIEGEVEAREREAKERATNERVQKAIEAREREAKERGAKTLVYRALDRASKEQVVKAFLKMGPADQLLKFLPGEAEAREREAKEMAAKERVQKAIEGEIEAKERATQEGRQKAIESEDEAKWHRLAEARLARSKASKEGLQKAVEGEIEAKEREAKEEAMKERLHKAVDRASKEQLVKAFLEIGSVEQLLRALPSEGEAEAREREAKEKLRRK